MNPYTRNRRILAAIQIFMMITSLFLMPFAGVTPAAAAPAKEPAAAPAVAPQVEPAAHPSLIELFGNPQADAYSSLLQATTSGPGICSNDKTKACATNADCGGNTCYLPSAGGKTLSDQKCMQDVAGFGINCTANDINLAATSNLVIVKPCDYPGDTAIISFVAQYNLTAQDRYDVGVWIAEDGGNALTGKCSVSNFPIAPTPPWTNLDATAQPTDTCGDITSSNNPLYSSIQNIPIQCVDKTGGGTAAINTCLSWRQSGANGLCTSPLQAFPGSPSKCKCQSLPGIAINIPPVIKVIKVTDPAGDPTSFPFTLTGGPGNITKPFNVTTSAPFNSGGLKQGTYAVTESVPGGWQLTGATCTSDQAGRTPTPGNIVLHNGETVTCTFNDKFIAAPALSLVKQIGASATAPWSSSITVAGGSSVYYQFTINNTGNVPLSPVSVSDPTVSTASCTWPASLAAGASASCVVGPMTAQTLAGTYPNTATAHGGYGGKTYDSAPSSANYIVAAAPALSLAKIATPNTYSKVGDVISYSYVVKNTGNVTLAGPVTVSDDKATVTCPAGGLAPQAEMTCTASYTITQADLDSGSVTNTATASANGVTSNQATATVTAVVTKSLSLTKTATPTTYTKVGEVISYSYVVKNTGNVTLAGPVTVSDDKAAVTCPAGGLAPQAEMICTASYTITQADLDAGSVKNTAKASANGTDSNPSSQTVTAVQTPALTLVKAASPTTYKAVGDVISYSYLVTNSGNVTLAGPVTVADDKATVTCPAGGLAPGASMTCIASYTITQADLDAGSVTNKATASTSYGGKPVPSNEATATVTAVQHAHLTLTKVATEANFNAAGVTLHYTLVATNDGNVTLNNVSITDAKLGALTCTPAQPATLAPAATLSCTGTYVTTQADVDAGKVDNTANAGGMFGTTPVNALPASASVPAVQSPHLTLVKTATPNFTTPVKIGDTISYELVATNDGNVTLSNVSISDAKLGTLTCTPAQPATLAPLATLSCTGSYALTQADIDAGKVDNTAFATSKLPDGKDGPGGQASQDVPVPQAPHLTLAKTATPNFSMPVKVGDTISYQLVATNDGNVTLNNVSISDAKLGTLTCTPAQPATLAPAATLSCTGSYSLTQADIDAGKVDNIGIAKSDKTPPTETPNDVPVPQAPHLSLTKTATPTLYSKVGDVISYSYVVKNTGNVTLSGPFTVADDKATVTCPAGGLAPQAEVTCTASYTITQADLDAGSVTNKATASTSYGGKTVSSNEATATVTAVQTPAISLTKSASPTLYNAVGDVIAYTLDAKNTGNVTLHGVTTSDPKLGTLTCTPTQPATLAPAATLSCTGIYTIVAGDLLVNSLTNTATVNGAGPAGQPVSATASATIYRQAAALLPTMTTCQMYAAGPSAWPAMYSAFVYQAKGGAINSVSPGVIFYYNTITAPGADFTLIVPETNSLGWKPMLIQDLGQANLFNADCSKTSIYTVAASGTTSYDVTFTVKGATPGATYYIGIKYSPANLVGQSVQAIAGVYLTSLYSWTTTGYPGSDATIPVKPK